MKASTGATTPRACSGPSGIVVGAFKIGEIVYNGDTANHILYPEKTQLRDVPGVEVPQDYFRARTSDNSRPLRFPAEYIGGYLVQYEDGYLSWSPAEAFEKGYTRIG